MNKTFFFFCFFFIIVQYTKGQIISSATYDMDNGLSNNRVNCIIQDENGFIWIGTDDGLCRFDGIRFKTFRLTESFNENASNYISRIIIDSRKRMWLGTNNGIVIFDSKALVFKSFDIMTNDSIRITTPIRDIIEDKNKNIWIGTNGQGVFKFNYKEEIKLKEIIYSQNNQRKTIMSLYEDSKNNIWLGTYSDGLYRYNKDSEKIIHYRHNSNINSLSDNSIHKIFEDSHGNLWIGTFQNGIDKFDYETETFRNFKDNSENNLLYHIHDIDEISPGNLLVSSDNGVCYFTTDDMSVKRADNSSLKFRFKPNKFIYTLFIDNEQGLWLGSYFNGVQYFSPFQNNFKHYTCYNNDFENEKCKVINCIKEDGKGNYWIGTDDDGIYHFNTESKTVNPFRIGKDINSTYYCIHDILIDKELMYIATYERGMEVIDMKSDNVKSYLNNPKDSTSIVSSKIYKLFKASDGRLYIGTADGLCYFKNSESRFVRIGDIRGIVQTITEDNNGIIWAGSKTDGILSFNIKNNKFKTYRHNDKNSPIPSNSISVITMDNNKRIWVGTEGHGLCIYDDKNDRFIKYKNLDLPNNIISSIVAYGDNLWISTNKGITCFNPHKKTAKTYSKSSGLINEQFTIGASHLSENGELVFGTANGFCVFQPQNLRENSYKAPLMLTDISVMGKPADIHNNKLTVEYDQNIIGFNFSVLSYTAPKENHYEYMLKGMDEGWIKTKGDNNHVSYNKIPPGKYVLKVKGKNSDKTDCSNEINLEIHVKPPFFRSNIAYLLYTIIVIYITFFTVRSYIKRSHRKQERNIMRITREKEKELYNSKIEFFTNIAHEIRTPLSLIIGPLDHLMQTTDINDKYGDYLNIIEHNYKRLYTLVNQLLDFRKVDSGALKFSYSEFSLKKLIQKTYMVFELTIRQKNININIDAIPDGYNIITDEESFTKIMSNLISNAIKYAKSNITIGFSDMDDRFSLSVTDDGPGIDDKDKKKIFEAFYQIKRKNDSNNPGIGIGLHITYALVQMMDGSITVDNRADGNTGVCFTVSLPKIKAESTNAENVSKQNNDEVNIEIIKEQNENKETATDNKKTVIVVDDNPDILDFLGKVLGMKYFVITAKSGEDCLSILENNKPDIIVSDVMMEGIDGFEVCRRIKNDINMSHIPVILLTAKTDTESKVEGLDSGADAYIEKPFAASHLIAQIENLLRKKEEFQKAFATNPLAEIHSVNQNKLDEEFIEQCTKIILENLDNSDFSINSLAQELNMSRTSIFTKIKGIMGMTPNDFIKVIKLKQAAKLLTEGKYRISEITYITGFSSSSYFAKCFQKQFGILPTDFVKQIKDSEQNSNQI